MAEKSVFGIDMEQLSKKPLTIETAQQIMLGLQKKIYGDRPWNSMEPFQKPGRIVSPDGEISVTEIRYGNEHPNSYLDITWPSGESMGKTPVAMYLHGGGNFAGDKRYGDPMAANRIENAVAISLVKAGFTLANTDYSLTPEGVFPIPLAQVSQAIDFLYDHAGEYHLDMSRFVLTGSSAGAILTAQYAALIANPAYQDALGIHPAFPAENLKAVLIDDAPLYPENFNWALRVMLGNYCGTVDTGSDIFRRYNPSGWFTSAMPPAFLDAGTKDGFPEDMKRASAELNSLGVETELFIPKTEQPHGFLNFCGQNEEAAEAVRRMQAFLRKHAG
ncbi:MAG: alpha/beta hydrolase [Lachnospiraceae bacterium]|jgi:acetyl esterase/lipase